MCTQEEVRQVVREEAPTWMKFAMGFSASGMLLLLGWLSFTAQAQDGYLKDFRAELGGEVNKLVVSTTMSNAMLASKIELLTLQMQNIKEVAITRNEVIYTITEARSRNAIVNERCKTMKDHLLQLEERINLYHRQQ